MSKDVATLDENNIVIAINIYLDDYELQPNQVLVTNPAYIGGDYFEGFFYSPKPFPSWSRDNKGGWIAPVPYPNDGKIYSWDEEAGDWVAINLQAEN
jgi:hypothetical protein